MEKKAQSKNGNAVWCGCIQQVLTVQRIKCDWKSYESSSASETAVSV